MNVNSVSQNSNNAASNSDNENTIMVMILPVPGKRSLKYLARHFAVVKSSCQDADLADVLLSEFFDELTNLYSDTKCQSYKVCNGIKRIMKKFRIAETVAIELKNQDKIPLMTQVECELLFPDCLYSM